MENEKEVKEIKKALFIIGIMVTLILIVTFKNEFK